MGTQMSPHIFIIEWQLIVDHLIYRNLSKSFKIYHNLSFPNYSSLKPPKSNFAGAGVVGLFLEDNDKS